ncbi:MAG: diadenylate cyclase, partial [Candidatus Azotimanducaceae bacterium]
MRIDRYIARNRVIDVESTDFRSALGELLDACDFSKEKSLTKGRLLKTLMERETQMTTYLGNGVCLPHARVKMKRPYLIAVGRCPHGLVLDEKGEYQDIRYVFLLLAAENTRSYLYSLASLARVFQDTGHMERLAKADSLLDFQKEIKSVFGGEDGKPRLRHNRFNNLILRESAKIAKGAECTSVLVFGDTFGGGVEVGKVFKGFKTVLIAQGTSEAATDREEIDAVIPIRAYSNHRFSQLRSAVLIGLTRGIFFSNDRLCCVGGLPQSNQFDSITVVDVEREFDTMLATKSDMLPA